MQGDDRSGRNAGRHDRKTEGTTLMIFSRDRILTTHVGSLPRNDKLSDLLVRQEAGETFDAAEMAAELDKAVTPRRR